MKRLPFILWAILWPLVCSAVKYLAYLRGFGYYTLDGEFYSWIVETAVYFAVAITIWRDEK